MSMSLKKIFVSVQVHRDQPGKVQVDLRSESWNQSRHVEIMLTSLDTSGGELRPILVDAFKGIGYRSSEAKDMAGETISRIRHSAHRLRPQYTYAGASFVMRQRPSATAPPLDRLRHLLQTRFPALYAQVLEPTLADLREEHSAALAEGQPLKARWILVQGCGALVAGAVCQLGYSLLGRIVALWQARSPK